MEKLIITVALTGNVPTKDMNKNLPITADEIAEDVRLCANAGASLFHVHARDKNENSPQFIEHLAQAFKETGVKPEIEVFEPGMINNAVFLKNKGLIKSPLHFNFVLGAPGSMPASFKNLLFLSESIPSSSTWTVSGIGRNEFPMAAAAILMGGHVRVGLEDNLFMPDGSPASNQLLVEKVVALARELGREIATPDEARAILSLH